MVSSMTVESVSAFVRNAEQNVSSLDAGLVCRAAAHHFRDQYALHVIQFERFRQFRREILHRYADPAARDRSGLDDLFHDLFCSADRDGETDAERTAIG